MTNAELVETLGADCLSVIHAAGKGGIFPGRPRREVGQRSLVGDGAVILVEFTVTVIGYQVPAEGRAQLFGSQEPEDDAEIFDAIAERVGRLEFHEEEG